MKNRIIFIAIILICSCASAQYRPPDGIYPDAVFAENIKTSRIFKEGWEISYPISNIDDDKPLVLTFDELSRNASYYSYAIIHCDADWQQSRLSTDEYMTGFPINRIRQFNYSFNTHLNYVHYRLTIPNEDVRLKVSGNYVVLVFEDGNESRPVMSRRFSIAESLAAASAWAGRARQTARQNEWQQVDFTVRTINYQIENAYNDLKITVIQNGKWNTARTDIKPLFVRQNEIDYRHLDETLLFHAGNEYRHLDTKSTQFSSTRMTAINFEQPVWNFYLYPDQPRSTGRYAYIEDWNGRYVIQTEKTNRPETEADYVNVHFTLQAFQPFDDGLVYVTGEFCNYAYTEENRMKYNPEKRQYETTILLKQGYYNYQYVLLLPRALTDDNRIEGNFSDTENDYIIYIYHRGRSSRYDRLIGVSIVNTLNN